MINDAPNFGEGQLQVTTAGGTSAPIDFNFSLLDGDATTRGIEQASIGDFFVGSGSQLSRYSIDGQLLNEFIDLPTEGVTITALDQIETPISILDTDSQSIVFLPEETLLVFRQGSAPGVVVQAVDPESGALLATLEPTFDANLNSNFQIRGGVFNPVSGSLFLLDILSDDEIIEIDPTTGSEIRRFVFPDSGGVGGAISVDPSSGNLWISTNEVALIEVSTDGEVLTNLDFLSGIIFLDEIDKVVAGEGKSADVSRQGVQRDLLPIVEGTSVQTKHGYVKTDHILFIAAGAFHRHQPSELMPELQGRFPIRVELNDLTQDDFVRILTEPTSSLTKQYQSLMATEGVTLLFTPDGIEELAARST